MLFLVATAVVLGVLLAAYAWSLAGGVRMTIDAPVLSGGGVAGGPPATDTAAVTLSWPLLLVYGAMLVLFCFAMFLAHLLDFDRVDHEMADAAMAAADARLSDREQELLCADLLEAHLNLIEPSKRLARSLIGCYISGARAEMSPELSGIWDSSVLEDLSLPDPEWVEEIGEMVKQLRRQDVVGRELKAVND